MRLRYLICLSLVVTCLQVGCRTVDLKPELRSDKYTVTTVLVESNVTSTLSEIQGKLEYILKRKDSKITRLPTVHLLPGDTTEINEQKPYTYPISFNADGTAKENKTVAIGQLVRITLHGTPEMKIRLKMGVFVEDAVVTGWRDISVPPDKSYRYPMIRRRTIGLDVFPQLNTWHFLGEADGVIFAARIDPPTGYSFQPAGTADR